MRSKEYRVLEPFFNTPKHWHFDELLEYSRLSRSRLSHWLRLFAKKGILKRIKPKSRMPYYIAEHNNPDFKFRKKLFARKKLMECGLLNHLSQLKNPKVIVLFGSFARSDWYDHSDIDVFIYGNDDEFNQARYESKLQRNIQVHNAKTKNELNKLSKMLPYILSGEFIKGSIEELGVEIYAKT